MAIKITRGSKCRISFHPVNGVSVDDLGTPKIGLYQDSVFLVPDAVIDSAGNRVYADLTEEDTMQLVEDISVKAQLCFVDDDTEEVYRFPVHELQVGETVFDVFYPTDEEIEPDPISYLPVDSSEESYKFANPNANQWMEKVGDDYILTADTYPIEDKQYYILIE